MRKLALLALVLSAVFLVITVQPAATAYAEGAQAEGADFRSGMIKYVLEDVLTDTPNTFEARVKLDKNAPAAVGEIFSNELIKSQINVSLSYFVDEDGHVCVNWNSEKYVDFDGYSLTPGEWTHIAVVRSAAEGTFTLYVNGESKQVVKCGAGTDIKKFSREHCIGGGWQSVGNRKKPFYGWIEHVTLYSDTLGAGSVMRDYLNPDNISYATRSGLMFNVRLKLGDVKLTDTSAYRNDAYIGSNDYFISESPFATKDYTLTVLPDLQMLTNHYQEPIATLPKYLLSNAQSMNIKAMITVGDITDGITNGKDWDRQYNCVAREFGKLDGTMTYVTVPGNHDYDNECKTDHSVSHLDGAFPVSKISKWESWGGSFSGSSVVNAYYLLEMSGVKYLIFALDFGPSDEVLEWACRVTEQHLDRRVIVATHGFLSGNGNMLVKGDGASPSAYGWNSNSAITVNDADEMWEKFLKKYPNIFMTVSGHVFGDDIIVREYVGDHGNVMVSMLFNAQGIIMNNGLELMLGILNFDEKNQNIYVNYYSTIQNKTYNLQNQFVYSFYGNTKLLSTEYYSDGVIGAVEMPDREQLLKNSVGSMGLFDSNESAARDSNNGIAALVILIGTAIAVTVGAIVYRRRAK